MMRITDHDKMGDFYFHDSKTIHFEHDGNSARITLLKEIPHNTQTQDSEFKSVKGRLTLPPQKGSEGKLTQA